MVGLRLHSKFPSKWEPHSPSPHWLLQYSTWGNSVHWCQKVCKHFWLRMHQKDICLNLCLMSLCTLVAVSTWIHLGKGEAKGRTGHRSWIEYVGSDCLKSCSYIKLCHYYLWTCKFLLNIDCSRKRFLVITRVKREFNLCSDFQWRGSFT